MRKIAIREMKRNLPKKTTKYKNGQKIAERIFARDHTGTRRISIPFVKYTHYEMARIELYYDTTSTFNHPQKISYLYNIKRRV